MISKLCKSCRPGSERWSDKKQQILEENSRGICIKAGTLEWRVSLRPQANRSQTCFCGTGAQGHQGPEKGALTTGDRSPWLSMAGRAWGGPAREKGEEKQRGYKLTPAARFHVGLQQRLRSWTWALRRILWPSLPVTMSQLFWTRMSALVGLSEVTWSQPSLYRRDQVTQSTRASQLVGQPGLELISLVVYPVFFFYRSPTLVSILLVWTHHFGNPKPSIGGIISTRDQTGLSACGKPRGSNCV